MGKTEEDWNGLKLGFLKIVQPNSFLKLIPAACSLKNHAQETFVFLGSLILSFICNFFAYFKFHSDWGRVIGKIKQNELDCLDTAPLSTYLASSRSVMHNASTPLRQPALSLAHALAWSQDPHPVSAVSTKWMSSVWLPGQPLHSSYCCLEKVV